jgi:signal transduction histidine kinase
VRASRRRLVLAADAQLRRIEHDLHEGVQQHLIALAVSAQLVSRSMDTDPATATKLLDQMERDVQQALDEASRIAQRINPPLESGGLAAALRAAAASGRVPASVEVAARASCPREVAVTVYRCWLEALDHATVQATVTVGADEAELAFVITGSEIPGDELRRLRDRVEALDGQLTTRSEPGGGTSITGSLPLGEPR